MAQAASDLSPDEEVERDLGKKMLDFYADPLGFVLFVFPWGEKGTPLAAFDGPDDWQRDFLHKLGQLIRAGFPAEQAIRMAVTSGHGVGKTALVAWLIIWFMATRPNPQVVVTANTQNQLTTKTWRELAKWNDVCLIGHWFQHTATQLKRKGREATWFATAVPWSASNSSAFAGTHEAHVLVIMDEASEIDSIIWEVTEGAMTTAGAMWFAFGNPTDNSTRFRQCWTKFRRRWVTYQVDSRNAKMADQNQIAEWIEDYGIDSDFVKVRVRGEFPSTGAKQLISIYDVEKAEDRGDPKSERYADPRKLPVSLPKIMGIDIGSYGTAENVIVRRQGNVMFPDIIRFREGNHTSIAGRIAEAINKFTPDIVFVDANGHGHGVYLLLVQLGYDNVVPVYAGERLSNKGWDGKIFYNQRILMWYRMKRWIEGHGAIPSDNPLKEDLIAPQYEYDIAMRMRLERKEDMEKRGVASPDTGDALAMTFAEEVPSKTSMGSSYSDPDAFEPEYE